jgi:hypothetical protein
MSWIEKIGAELKKLGFDNFEHILSAPHYSTDGQSAAIGTYVDVHYENGKEQSDTIYFVFFVARIKDEEKSHIEFVIANYYLHGRNAKESLFNKMYSAATEIIPTKEAVVSDMKKIMLGYRKSIEISMDDKKNKGSKRSI